jgi:hypothetical protein
MVSHNRGDSLGQGLILLIPVLLLLPFPEWGFNTTYNVFHPNCGQPPFPAPPFSHTTSRFSTNHNFTTTRRKKPLLRNVICDYMCSSNIKIEKIKVLGQKREKSYLLNNNKFKWVISIIFFPFLPRGFNFSILIFEEHI